MKKNDLKIKVFAEIYALFLITSLILGVLGKVMSEKVAELSFLYLFFIGFPITTVIYIFSYVKWAKTLKKPFERHHALWLSRSSRKIHQLMFSIAQFIMIGFFMFGFEIIKKILIRP